MSPTRVQRPVYAMVVFALATLVLVVMPGTQARAEPTVTEIEAQINKIWLQAEPLIEEYNGIHEKYKQNKAKQAELQTKIEPLERQVDLARIRIGVIAAQVYRGGQADTFNALLTSDSPRMLAEQLSFLDTLALNQERQIKSVTDLKDQYDAQKAPIDALVAELAKQDAELAAKKKTIEAKLSELQRLRNQLYGSTGATGSYRPWPCPSAYEPTKGYKVAKFACAQAGKPYVWAADGPSSYDCSGLTLASWKQVGVYLPHQSQQQRNVTAYVSRANLRMGDLVFYYNPIHHVGVYVGNNKIMHAPRAGDRVHMADMFQAGPIHSYGRPS